jgi:hypothetical protein
MNVKKKFKPHMMYKGKKAVMAKTMADHLRLKKQGYGHDKPTYNDGGKVKGMTTAQRKEEYVKEKGKKAYNKSYDKAFEKDRNKTYGLFTRQYIPYKLASESDKVAKPIAKKSRKKAELNASKKFDQVTRHDDLLGRSTNPDKKYKKGGKIESKVNEAGNYTKPTMRKNLFNRIMAGTKGGRAGQWSARKAQLLAKLYKKNGGGYKN